MLTISHAQMERIADAREENFVSRLCAALRAEYEAETKGRTDTNLRDFVRSSMEDAYGYGLTMEDSVADFVGLAMQLGATFHKHPLVFDRLVADDDLTADERVAALFAQLTDAEWMEIADHATAVGSADEREVPERTDIQPEHGAIDGTEASEDYKK